jgi:ATP-binding cassette subfamily A (ABC1) protein 3
METNCAKHVRLMVVLYLTAYITISAQADPSNVESEQTIVHFTLGLITPAGQLIRAFLLGLNLFSIICKGSPPEKATNPGEILIYGGPILYLIVQSLLLFGYLVWSDHRFSLGPLRRPNGSRTQRDAEDTTTKEKEVMDEITRVTTSNDGLRVLHVEKTFKSFAYGAVTAVEDLSFGVKHGEIFAIIGPNGGESRPYIPVIDTNFVP